MPIKPPRPKLRISKAFQAGISSISRRYKETQMPVQSAKRGAIPASRNALAAAPPYTAERVAPPPTYIVIPALVLG
jgi:hypothetical protein